MKKFLVALTLALVLVLGCVVIASADGEKPLDDHVYNFGELGSIEKVDGANIDTTKAFKIIIDATCQRNGIAMFYAKDYAKTGEVHYVYFTKDNLHKYVETVIVAATCTESGRSKFVCSVCGDEYESIKTPLKHTDAKHKIAYWYAPTCTSAGYGYIVCDRCGEPFDSTLEQAGVKLQKPANKTEAKSAKYEGAAVGNGKRASADPDGALNKAKGWIMVPAKGHDFSDWKYEREATCYITGIAKRTCRSCGFVQRMASDVTGAVAYVDKAGKEYETVPEGYTVIAAEANFTEGKKEVKPESYVKTDLAVIGLRNKNYNKVYTNIEGGKETTHPFNNVEEMENAIKDALKKEDCKGATVKVKSNEFFNCTMRKVTYVCPLCESPAKLPDPHEEGVTVHAPIVLYVKDASHIWRTEPQKNATAEQLTTAGIKYKVIKDTGIEEEDFVAKDWYKKLFDEAKANAVLKNLSIAPTCELPGYKLYLCKYDNVKVDGSANAVGADGVTLHDHPTEDEYIVEMVPATGHQWTEWEFLETFTKDGKELATYIHRCTVCKKEEHKTEDYVAPVVPVKDGLTKDDDGTWRYYKDGEFQDDLTAHVDFEGEKFLVVNGELADVSGLVLSPVDNTFHLMVHGQLQNDSTTVVYGDDTFMVINGVLNTEANGLYDYEGGKFVFAAGRLIKTVNGLWLNPKDNKFYYLANGQVQTQHSGVVEYNGEFFVVKNGVFDSSYNGTIEYDGKTFNVSNGQLYAIPVAEEPAA